MRAVSTSVRKPTVMITPSRNDPRTFTASVPHGKPVPNASRHQVEIAKRAPVPNAPPRQMRRNSITGSLRFRLDLAGLRGDERRDLIRNVGKIDRRHRGRKGFDALRFVATG